MVRLAGRARAACSPTDMKRNTPGAVPGVLPNEALSCGDETRQPQKLTCFSNEMSYFFIFL